MLTNQARARNNNLDTNLDYPICPPWTKYIHRYSPVVVYNRVYSERIAAQGQGYVGLGSTELEAFAQWEKAKEIGLQNYPMSGDMCDRSILNGRIVSNSELPHKQWK